MNLDIHLVSTSKLFCCGTPNNSTNEISLSGTVSMLCKRLVLINGVWSWLQQEHRSIQTGLEHLQYGG
jgi:hypothetical protein